MPDSSDTISTDAISTNESGRLTKDRKIPPHPPLLLKILPEHMTAAEARSVKPERLRQTLHLRCSCQLSSPEIRFLSIYNRPFKSKANKEFVFPQRVSNVNTDGPCLTVEDSPATVLSRV